MGSHCLAYYPITNIHKQLQHPQAIGRQKQNPDPPSQMAHLIQKVLPGGPVAPWPPGKPGRPVRHSAGFPGKPGSPGTPGEPRSPKRKETGFTMISVEFSGFELALFDLASLSLK